MKHIALLHHDWEWTEKLIKETFAQLPLDLCCHDIRQCTAADLTSYDLVINRVYASVANRDYPSVVKVLNLIEALEDSGIQCLAGAMGARADYDKFFAYQRQLEAGVRLPQTKLIQANPEEPEQMKEDILAFGLKHGFPVVLKPNTGGRGKDVHRIDREDQVESTVQTVIESRQDTDYTGAWIVQAFLESVRPYDCRIAVHSGEIVHAYRRTLISMGSSSPWLASRSLGSEAYEHDLQKEEAELAILATKAIQSEYNMLDIAFGRDGPVVIENNITPNFVPSCPEAGPYVFLEGLIRLTLSKSRRAAY